MTTCTRRIQFCAGHRVVGHENKCANVHGHNYVIEIFAEADKLDGVGRIIDFSVLKGRIGKWIEDNWDHTFICAPNEDPGLIDAIEIINNKPIYRLPYNPTAENMAMFLLENVCPEVLKDCEGVGVIKIVLHETENCWATVER